MTEGVAESSAAPFVIADAGLHFRRNVPCREVLFPERREAMNGILLGLACFGALAAIVSSEMTDSPPAPATPPVAEASLTAQPGAPARDPGSMTMTRNIDPETGEVTEISVIAFRD